MKEEKKETRKKLKMKMRPMRVKVRKPAKNFQSFMMKENKKEPKPNLGFGDSSMGTMLDEEFGLKNGVTNEDLVLEPTPAVPGRPIILEDEEDPVRMRNKFNEFLPSTTPAPVIPVANIKTVDFQKEDMSNSPMDYPIYDTENRKPFPPIKMSEFPNMPIFSNFPMMAPNEFVQPSLGEGMEDHNLPGYSEEQEDYEDYMDKPSFTAFNEERPESINLFKEDGPAKDPPAADELESLVNRFNEEADIEAEIRPVRRPSQNPTRSPYNSVHPNHRYPLNRPTAAPAQVSPTPFTVRSRNTIVPHSYMKNSYKHTAADNNFRSGGTQFLVFMINILLLQDLGIMEILTRRSIIPADPFTHLEILTRQILHCLGRFLSQQLEINLIRDIKENLIKRAQNPSQHLVSQEKNL